MDLKFYLNKFVKVDNIEGYSLKALTEIKKLYEEYLDKTDGSDPDFPMITFGGEKGKRGKKVKGRNAASENVENNEER